MRNLMFGAAAAALLAQSGALGARKEVAQPVGLLVGAGATITRDKRTAAVKPGELVFAGDMVDAGSTAVQFLFCPQKISGAVAARGRVVFEEKELSGAVEGRKPAAACLLPVVQRFPVASRRNAGVVLPETGPSRPVKVTFEQRVRELPADVRTTLEADLAAAKGDEAGVVLARAAALEKAGLLYDAAEAYRALAGRFDEATWVKRKVVELEHRLKNWRAK